MAYPHTRLTRQIRIAIMLGLIVLFFSISPLVLLYTAGYRFDFKTRQFQKTGVISVDIEPRDATVMLNDVVINKRMPLRLANRAPGRYTLTISKAGYHTLKKDIDVESKQTTYVRDIPLFKDSLPTRVFAEHFDAATKIRISSDGRYAVLVSQEGPKLYRASVLDLTTVATITSFTITADSISNIEWSPIASQGIIVSTLEKTHTYHLFDATKQAFTPSYIVRTASEPTHQWHVTKNNTQLFVKDGDQAIMLTMNGSSPKTTLFSPVWHIDQQDSVWEFDITTHLLQQKNEQQVVRSWKLSESLVDIFSVEHNKLIGRTSRGIAIITLLDTDINIEQLATEMIQYNQKRNEWISWSSSEIWRIIDGTPTLLTRLGLPIQHVYPMDEFGTLLIDTGEKLFGFHPQFFSIQPLFERGTVDTQGINQKSRTVYLIGKVGNGTNLFELTY